MRFEKLPIDGSFLVRPEPVSDDRGLFARTFCRDEFAARGLAHDLVQCSTSYNRRAGTLRGMHYQAAPMAETKLVRCVNGRIFDVMVDLRPLSATYLHWHGVDLSADDRNAVYVPAGVAHGFLTRSDDAEVFYMMDRAHAPDLARAVRWNDPAFAIRWPAEPTVISARDASVPDYRP